MSFYNLFGCKVNDNFPNMQIIRKNIHNFFDFSYGELFF